MLAPTNAHRVIEQAKRSRRIREWAESNGKGELLTQCREFETLYLSILSPDERLIWREFFGVKQP